MAKYKKSGLLQTDENDRFEMSVKRLTNFYAAKELERRRWAGDVFGNPDHVLVRIVKIFIMVLTLFTYATLAIYLAIRSQQVLLAELGQLSYKPAETSITMITVFLLVCGAVLLAANVLLIFKKHTLGAYMAIAAEGAVLIHILTSLNIPMPTADQLGRSSSYFNLFLICSAVYFILILCAAYILFCVYKTRHTVKKLTNEALLKISRSSNELLSPDEYSEKIEEYIKKEKQKIVDESAKRGGSIFKDND